MEEWKDVGVVVVGRHSIDCTGLYEVSSFGQVRSMDRVATDAKGVVKHTKGRILKPRLRQGYHRARLSVDGIVFDARIHRLMAVAFIPNPDNKPTINHKNGIRNDNRLSNLEWNTYSENNQHAVTVLGRKAPWLGKKGAMHHAAKAVQQLDVDSNVIKTFPSMSDAGKEGFLIPKIVECCKGRNHTHAGFKWRYA